MKPRRRRSLRATGALAITLAVSACREHHEPTAPPPDSAPTTATSNEATAPPPPLRQQTVTTPPRADPVDLSELRDALHEQALEAFEANSLRAHPLLPDTWPPSGRVRVYGHRRDALPTGIAMYRVWSADRYVVVDLATREAELVALGTATIAADRAARLRAPATHDLAAAEEALLAVCRGADPAPHHSALQGYQRWLESEPHLESEIRGYAPGFFAWLSEPAH